MKSRDLSTRSAAEIRGGSAALGCDMMGSVGGYGYPVIDADGHGGEPLKWRRRIPDAFRSRIVEYVRSMKSTHADVPGGGARIAAANPREASFRDDERDDLTDSAKWRVLADNAARLYGLAP